jgi:hypothetical protein
MAFEDYENPRTLSWKVREATGSSRCNPTCKITITGTENHVTVTCRNLHPYGRGTYQEGTGTILGDAYELRWEAGPPHRVICGFPRIDDPNGTGSWTADDNLPEEG